MSIDTTQVAVLQALVALLRTTLTLNDRQCYEAPEPAVPPTDPPGGDYVLTVAPADGRFDEAEQAGGGAAEVREEASVVVTICVHVDLDTADHLTRALYDAKRGLLSIKRLVLKTLAGQMLTSGTNPLLTDYMAALQSWKPRRDESREWIMIGVAFSTDFNWDLS